MTIFSLASEWNVRFDDGSRFGGDAIMGRPIDRRRGNDATGLDHLFVETRVANELEVLDGPRGDGTEDTTVQQVDSTRRIAERPRYATRFGPGHLYSEVSERSTPASSSEEIPKKAFTRVQ